MPSMLYALRSMPSMFCSPLPFSLSPFCLLIPSLSNTPFSLVRAHANISALVPSSQAPRRPASTRAAPWDTVCSSSRYSVSRIPQAPRRPASAREALSAPWDPVYSSSGYSVSSPESRIPQAPRRPASARAAPWDTAWGTQRDREMAAPYVSYTPKAQAGGGGGGYEHYTPKALEAFRLRGMRFEGWSQTQRSGFLSFPTPVLTELARAASPCVNDPGFIYIAYILINTTTTFIRLCRQNIF
jgi:hypothetical protein